MKVLDRLRMELSTQSYFTDNQYPVYFKGKMQKCQNLKVLTPKIKCSKIKS